MDAVGIVAEYNPFHNGHKYHISQSRRVSCREDVVAAVSASFTQRGEPACLDKFTRARHALLGGADLVIEIPDVLSCSCAERFCGAGVRLLSKTGLVGALSFGSECGDIASLNALCECDPDGVDIRTELAKGVSYPKAAANVLAQIGSHSGELLPNDILALEYIRAIKKYSPGVSAFPVKREGAGYNSDSLDKEFASASAIRARASSGSIAEARAHLPDFVYGDMLKGLDEGRFPASLEALSAPILYALRKLGRSGIAALADVSEGLENVIYPAALEVSDVIALLDAVKSKRYSLARLRRILCYALMGTTAELQRSAAGSDEALYIRVLGVRKEKMRLLSELSERAELPVITKFADTEALPPLAKTVLEHTQKASLIRALGSPRIRSAADDFSYRLITV